MDIICTRPSCENPQNAFFELDDNSILKTVQQKYCSTCGMPLILDGRYLPVQLLGKGGFGAAYLACDRRTPAFSHCVVKQFQPQSGLSTEQFQIAQTLFDREAEVLDRLGSQHNQIPRLLASFPLRVTDSQSDQVNQFFYLVQEYLECCCVLNYRVIVVVDGTGVLRYHRVNSLSLVYCQANCLRWLSSSKDIQICYLIER